MKHISKYKFLISLPLSFSFALSACNFSKVNRVEHEAAAPEVSQPTAKEQAQLVSLRSNNLTSIYQKTLAIKTAQDASSIIKELQTTVLTSEVLGNPKLNMEDNVASALTYYNEATLQLLNLAPDSEEAKAQSTKYISLVATGCTSDLENCTRIRWMKRDPRTHTVLSKIARIQDSKIADQCSAGDCNAELTNLFRTISLSFATNNQIKDTDLYQVFAKRIHQYAAILEKNGDTEGLKRQGIIFDSILANLTSAEDEKIILPIVKAQPPWSYSRKNSQSFNFGSEKIFLVASKNLLYENGALNPQLKKIMLDEQKGTNARKDSIYTLAKTLSQSQNTKHIFKTLNFDPSVFLSDSFYDEYFFMIDRLMGSHLNYDEVEAIWKGSKKNIELINKKIREIAKLELINLVVLTNQYFSALLQTKNLPSNRLFIKSIDESRPLTDTWDQYFSQLSKVSNLLGQISANNQLAASEQKTIESTKSFIIGAKRNAKFLSVYPNMLNLGYFMIKVDAMFTTKTWWGSEISIDPKTIVDYLLDGGFDQPWYLFSGDTNPINKSEIILAFDYALRLGSFEIFGQALDEQGKSKIDRIQFFKALKSTMDSNIKDLKDTIESMEKLEGDSDIDRVLRLCGTKDLSGLTMKMKLDDFAEYALFGSPSKGYIGYASKFYDVSSAYYNIPPSTAKTAVTSMRSLINSRFLQLRAMSLPLVENIRSLDIPEKDKQTLLDNVNGEIKDVTKMLGAYYALALNNHHLIKDCTQRLVREERKREFFLINAEKNFLNQIYDAMLALFNEKDAAKKVASAKTLAEKLNLASGDDLQANSFVSSKYDLYKRFERYSKDSSLTIKVDADPLDESTVTSLVSDRREVPFINLQTGQPLDRMAFIKSGLSLFNTQGANIIQWFRSSTNTKLAQRKLDTMIAVYKLGFDLGLQSTPVKYKERKLNPITAKDITKEAIDLARSLSISPEEEEILRLVGQYELFPMSDLQGYLFDASETDYYGILDNVFLMGTRVQEDLDEAARYYQERINTKREDAMIFPMDPKIEAGIHKVYQRLIKKDEALIADFVSGVREAQKDLEKNPLHIVYRLLEGTNARKVYSSDLIPGGNSILVDERKIKSLIDNMYDFHNRITFRVYKTELATEQGDQ